MLALAVAGAVLVLEQAASTAHAATIRPAKMGERWFTGMTIGVAI
jgi:hypothetical protein